MAFKIGELFWKVIADTSKFNSELKKSETTATGFGATMTKVAKLVKIAMASTAVVGIAKVSAELINAASDAEEVGNKFNVVFRDISDDAEGGSGEPCGELWAVKYRR